MAGWRLYDMHCHLGFYAKPALAARRLSTLGVGAMCCTVSPRDYERAALALAGSANVRIAVGAHPWWVADGSVSEEDLERACELARTSRWVGEIGLDYARGRDAAQDAQLRGLRRMLAACAGGGHVLSIHAVRSVTDVLDELERAGATRSNACVLHWFSGTSDELTRATRMGCLFSVGPRMLRTRRGRAYARQVPRELLLLETDLPEPPGPKGPQTTPDAMAGELERSLATLCEMRGADMGETMAQTAEQLLA